MSHYRIEYWTRLGLGSTVQNGTTPPIPLGDLIRESEGNVAVKHDLGLLDGRRLTLHCGQFKLTPASGIDGHRAPNT